MIVQDELSKLGILYDQVAIGEVSLRSSLTPEEIVHLDAVLHKYGLEIIEGRKTVIVEKIKNIITNLIYDDSDTPTCRYSDFIQKELNYNYPYLASMFSKTQGMTIESFIIAKKIERVKSLLKYEGLSLTEISYKLNYSSVAHLSYQFKKVTGQTPSQFMHENEIKTDS